MPLDVLNLDAFDPLDRRVTLPLAGPRWALAHEPPGLRVQFDLEGQALVLPVVVQADGGVKLTGLDVTAPVPLQTVQGGKGWQSLAIPAHLPGIATHLLVWGWMWDPPSRGGDRRAFNGRLPATLALQLGQLAPLDGSTSMLQPQLTQATVQSAIDRCRQHAPEQLDAALLALPVPSHLQ